MKRVSITKIVLTCAALLGLAMGMSALKDSLPLTKGTVIKANAPAVQALKKKRKKKRYWAKKETSINESMQAGPTYLAYDQASKIWFAATDGKNGQQLWSYDITSGTTQQIVVNPSDSAQISSIATDPNACYFSANRPPYGQEVHQYTQTGGITTFDINAGTAGSYPSELFRADSSLFFSAQSPGGTELYRLNIPTRMWKYYNLNNDPYCTLPKYLTLGPLGKLFFQGYYPGIGTELGWFKYGDETSGSYDLNPGAPSSNPAYIQYDPNQSLPPGFAFAATVNPQAGNELAVLDPNSPSSPVVYDLNPGASSSFPTYIQIDKWGQIICAALTSALVGTEPTVLDPNSSTPVQNMKVFDVNAGTGSSDVKGIKDIPGEGFYFNAYTAATGNELWFAPRDFPWDPSPSGPPAYDDPRLAEIFSGVGDSNPAYLINVNGRLFFAATDSDNHREVWSCTIDGLGLTSPNGGESWQPGSNHAILWGTQGKVDNVRVEYSTDGGTTWTLLTNSTPNTGTYPWAVPATPSATCLVQVSNALTPEEIYGISEQFFSIATNPPRIQVNRSQLNFGAVYPTFAPPGQTFVVQNAGGGVLNWTGTSDRNWLAFAPQSGGSGTSVTVIPDSHSLDLGAFSGIITISDPNAVNSPQSVAVNLNVYPAQSSANPFGSFDTPTAGSTVMSSIPVTGWALDDIRVDSVKIWTQWLGADQTLYLIGDAVFVEGARPDIEQSFPNHPYNYRAGWGYMMLTYGLPGQGNGTYVFHAIATDYEGHTVTLGTKTIHIDNAHAVKPFGAIDSPSQGGTASGSAYRNWGWVLTPLTNTIPTDGSTLSVWVDGVNLGHPVYNLHRQDVADFFPSYNNSGGAGGYYDIDTTAYTNAVHTIQWTASDNGGNADGIGSRYFTIQNAGSAPVRTEARLTRTSQLASVPAVFAFPARFRRGSDPRGEPDVQYPDWRGLTEIGIREVERLEVHLDDADSVSGRYSGYLVVGRELRPLPIGSTLDAQAGIFFWLPGPGFLGAYDFVFLHEENGRIDAQRRLTVRIDPKY